MAFGTLADIVESASLRRRIVACAALEGAPQPASWVASEGWALPTSEWIAAWESAVAAELDDPGADPGVITDAAILAAVQSRAHLPRGFTLR